VELKSTRPLTMDWDEKSPLRGRSGLIFIRPILSTLASGIFAERR
jgi:hypothetical protein